MTHGMPPVPDDGSVAPARAPWWRGGTRILVARTGDALLRFALFLATARLLDSADFSRYALLTAALGASQGLFALAGPRTAAYFQGRSAAPVLAAWLTAVAAVPSLLLLGAMASLPSLRLLLFPSLTPGLVLLGFAPLPLLLLSDSLSFLLLAQRREKLYGALLWSRSAATAAALASSLFSADRLPWLLFGRLAVAAAMVAALVVLLPVRLSFRGLPEFARRAGKFALPAAAGGALVALHRRADVFLLSTSGRIAEIGTYAVAYTIAEGFWIVTDSLEAALFVDLAQLEDGPARRRTRHAAIVYGALAACASIGLFAGLGILRAGFASRYPRAPELFPWVLFAAILWGTSRPFSSYLFSRGRGSLVLAAHAAGLAVNVGLCLLWIPRAGALGAARATLVSYLTVALLLALLARGKSPASPELDLERTGDLAGTAG